MVSLILGLVLTLAASVPKPTSLVRTAARAVYIHRRIQANTALAIKGMDTMYSRVIPDEKLDASATKRTEFSRKRLLQALAVYRVLHSPGCLRRTPEKALRLGTAVGMMIPGLLRKTKTDARQASMAGAQVFLARIRAANAAATALWLKEQSRHLYSLLLSLGIDGFQDIPRRLDLAAKRGDASAARFAARMRRNLTFSFINKGLRNPLANSKPVRRFGLQPDPKYPLHIAGPGVVLAWPGHGERNTRAVAEGMVISIMHVPGIGLTVLLDHGNGLRSAYGGLAQAGVSVNEMVMEGTVLGQVTCKNAPCLLFFAMEVNGKWTNPLKFVNPQGVLR